MSKKNSKQPAQRLPNRFVDDLSAGDPPSFYLEKAEGKQKAGAPRPKPSPSKGKAPHKGK